MNTDTHKYEAAWAEYMAWVRQFAREYAAACRNAPPRNYRLCEHDCHDEWQEAYDMLREEMQMTDHQMSEWRGA